MSQQGKSFLEVKKKLEIDFQALKTEYANIANSITRLSLKQHFSAMWT
jgi:hypothetical protein